MRYMITVPGSHHLTHTSRPIGSLKPQDHKEYYPFEANAARVQWVSVFGHATNSDTMSMIFVKDFDTISSNDFVRLARSSRFL